MQLLFLQEPRITVAVRIFIFCTVLFLSFRLGAQVNIADGGTVVIPCAQEIPFTDSNGGGPYAANENFQITICPDAGNAVILRISTDVGDVWDVADGDFLTVYNGDNTGAELMGSFNSVTHPGGIVLNTTVENGSGCMTLVFTSNGQGQGQGFQGIVSCGTGWQPYTIALTSDPADGENQLGYVDICPGEEVSFSVAGDYPYSTAGNDGYFQSDATMMFNWNLGDGTILNGVGLTAVTHTFPGQFGYNVVVSATDDLGLNRVDTLKVRVSTTPGYQTAVPAENPICLGQSTDIIGGFVDVENNAGFEPTPGSFYVGGLSAGQFPLPDGSGLNHTDTIFITGIDPALTISSAADFLSLCVNIEHSFLGDLEMGLTCPDGTMINIFNGFGGDGLFPGGFGGGGTFLGDATDDSYFIPGVGFDYCFSLDAVWGTLGEELANGNTVPVSQGNAMAPGTYQPEESWDSFIGCPVAGPWVITVRDNIGIDDGYIFGWEITLNPALYPDPEFYTPVIVDAFWEDAPGIIDSNALNITVQPETPGLHDFQFVVVDNFGCQYDTLVTVLVVEPPTVFAGDNLFLACSDAQLNGLVNGEAQPQCSDAAGTYTYCYGNSENTVFTYCPDNPGDGVTFLTLTINAGSFENFFDSFLVYDGPDIGAPLIADLEGNVEGLSFTATQNGCITIQIQSDGSVSCQSGSQTELNYTISCTSSESYDISWTPTEFLSDPTILNPLVSGLTADQVFTLTAAPSIAPQCAVSDDVLVSIGDPPSAGEDAEIDVCPDGEVFPLFSNLGGTPDLNGVWMDADGNAMDGFFDPTEDEQGVFTYSFPGCDDEAEVTVNVPVFSPVLSADTTICNGGTASLSVQNPFPDATYAWSNGASGQSIDVSPLSDVIYTMVATFGPNCQTEAVETEVEVLGLLELTIEPGGTICPGDSIEIAVVSAFGGLAPYTYTWTSDVGIELVTESAFVSPPASGNWCCTITDACETPPGIQCITIDLAEAIDPTFTVDTLGGCVPIMVGFQGNATNVDQIGSAVWEFGNGSISTQPVTASHTYQVQGIYDVTYTAISVDGCVFTHTEENLLALFNQPSAGFNFSPQTAVLPDTRVDFTNYSLSSDDWMWLFNSVDSVFDFNPTYAFPDTPGLYPVTLYVSNNWGCTDSLTRYVFVVDEFTMFIPNAFTPDNDGINDVFRFTGYDVDTDYFELLIFDRWGEVVHRTTDFEAGWNGNYNNGEHYVPDGVYLYRIETRSLSTQENKVVEGHVSIIR